MTITGEPAGRDPRVPENPPVNPVTDEERKRNSSTSQARQLADIKNA